MGHSTVMESFVLVEQKVLRIRGERKSIWGCVDWSMLWQSVACLPSH